MADQLPTLELLEARHAFPCRYTFKVIGDGDLALEAAVAACVRRELALDHDPRTAVKRTAGGRHQSVTVDPTCPDAQSVLDLYRALRALDGVLYLF